MERLNHQEAGRLLECVGRLHDCSDADAFPNHLLGELARLIPGDGLIYNEMNVARRRIIGCSWPGDQVGWSVPDEVRCFFLQHPIFELLQRTGDIPAVRLSDFMSRREYHKSALYREIFRGLGVEYQLGCALPNPSPRQLVSLSISRSGRDFSERERLMLDLLRPHLLQAYANAERVSALRAELAVAGQALEESKRGLITLAADGQISSCTAAARRWLEDYFGPLGPNRLPAALSAWLLNPPPAASHSLAGPTPPGPLTIRRPGRQLVVRQLCKGAVPPLLLLAESRLTDAVEPLLRLGLTPREAEVLRWVAQGKTNGEIGVILGLSARTVHKHLEHIFIKLGVENRTTAAARALEAIQAGEAEV